MSALTLALVASLSMTAAPRAGIATALRLARPSPKPVLDARFTPQAQSTPPQFVILSIEPEPTDCGMVKPVDPNFKSAMPVATPDPNLAFPMKVVPVPSCDKQRR